MGNFEFDRKSGMAANRFDVEVSGSDLVFRAGGGRRERLSEISEEIDVGGMSADFCGISKRRRGGRVPDGIMPGVEILRGCGPQYSLNPEGGEEVVLGLARRIGPLFGNYHLKNGHSDEIIEPISWWVQASGVYCLASTLRSCLEGRCPRSFLDDEVVFVVAADMGSMGLLERFAKGEHPTMLTAAVYAKDDELCPPYEGMLTVDRFSRPRVFPIVKGDYGDMGTEVRADYNDLRTVRVDFGEYASTLAGLMSGMPIRPPSREEIDRVARKMEARSSSVRTGRQPICGKVIFGYRAQHRKDAPHSSASLPESLEGELSGDGRMLLTWGNDVQGDDGFYLPLYEDLYNALVGLHTWRCSDELRRGLEASPVYTCVLEHLWASFGRESVTSQVSFCAYCGKAFRAEGNKRYCCALHGEEAKADKKRRRASEVEAALRHFRRGEEFRARDVSGRTDGRVSEEQALSELRRLKALKRKSGVRVRSKGGNGLGERFVVE